MSTFPPLSTATQVVVPGRQPMPLIVASGSIAAALQAFCPPVGLVETSTPPLRGYAKQCALGQDMLLSAVTSFPVSTGRTCHAPAPPPGSVEESSAVLPAESAVTHRWVPLFCRRPDRSCGRGRPRHRRRSPDGRSGTRSRSVKSVAGWGVAINERGARPLRCRGRAHGRGGGSLRYEQERTKIAPRSPARCRTPGRCGGMD